MQTKTTFRFDPSVIKLRLPEADLGMMVGAVFLGFAIRTTLYASQPLWLDETFTGAIAAEPSWTAVFYQILQDTNAPLYYILAHAWSILFGLSNASLRFPALVFGSIAPLICLIPTPGLTRSTRFLWCSIVSLWIPGFVFSQQARCYSMLLCLCVASTVSFIRLMDAPTIKRSVIWAFIGSLAILSHYYALVLIGCQGLAYLAYHRRAALRTWPSALVFAPVFIWLAIHIGRIATFLDPKIAWYRPLRWFDLIDVTQFAIGSFSIVALFAIVWVKAWAGGEKSTAAVYSGMSWYAVWTALAGAIFVITIGFWRPAFIVRYLIPFIPGILLGLVLVVERLRRAWGLLPAFFLLLYMAMAVNAVRIDSGTFNPYNFEAASDALIASGTKNLVFFWDHPDTFVEDPSQLAIVGGFFFKRRGVDVHVEPIKIERREDPNPKILAAAGRPNSSILWIYDLGVHDTAARVFPPRIEKLDPSWRCTDRGLENIGVVTCGRKEMVP